MSFSVIFAIVTEKYIGKYDLSVGCICISSFAIKIPQKNLKQREFVFEREREIDR